ncbi:hypothetical protein I4U23_015706 [Adineta vaga]|nr:hypothetical protein I4U23_015706 [Adineta vaga]
MLKSQDQSDGPLDLWYLSLITCVTSPDGQDVFTTSLHHAFDRLHPHFELQQREDFCGIACVAILLNSLLPYSKWTQSDLYSTIAHAHMSDGISLAALSHILTTFGLPPVIRYSDEERFEEKFLQDIKNPHHFVVVNYWRQFEWPTKDLPLRCGHFSLVAAYNEVTNRILILDTSDSIRPYHWLDLQHLMRMMCTRDDTAAMPRGYLIVVDPKFESEK